MKKQKLSPDTIEKLEWLKARLRKYPHKYDQRQVCGTQACLAGYCLPKIAGLRRVVLTDEQHRDIDIGWLDSSRDWLGITREMGWLLFPTWWEGDAREFNRLPGDTDQQAVKKACKRIDLFIESGGTI